MSSRRWITWSIFLICAALVLDGLGFVTWQVLRLERREAQATIESARQENERLALWRMDLFLAPLIAQESARPYFHYLPFYPAERAYTRMWEQVQPGDVLVPSPLLTSARLQSDAGDLIRLYFQIDPAGRFASPQVPTGNMLDLAESRFGMAGRIQTSERLLERIRGLYVDMARAEIGRRAERPASAEGKPLASERAASVDAPADREFERRAKTFEQAARPDVQTSARLPGDAATPGAVPIADDPTPGAGGREERDREDSAIRVGNFRPTWVRSDLGDSPELVFLRSVTVEGQVVRQGIWIDWPMLRTLLIAGVLDLLPEVSLTPLTEVESGGASMSRVLASLPVVLDPGSVPQAPPLGMTWVRATLGVTWLAVVAAVAAIGWVLRASLLLSERRGRFVSAVTHELRTPLTTFCLYTEMLDEGMVDPSSRQSYLRTLRSESNRLAGIVENVLAYARLGRPRPRADGAVGVAELIDQVREPLQRRADQAGAELTVSVAPEAERESVRGDAETIERVLFNLVDNACKYGRSGDAPARVALSVGREHGRVSFRVCDRGPGIAPGERERVFGAFQRGAVHASHAESGLGLGLALARGLAEEMGGELVVEPSEIGACFALRLRAG